MADTAIVSRATLALAAGTLMGAGLRFPPAIAVGFIVLASMLLLAAAVIPATSTHHVQSITLLRAVPVVSLIAGVAFVVSWTSLVVRLRGAGPLLLWVAILAVVIATGIATFGSSSHAHRYHVAFLAAFMVLQVAIIVATHSSLVSSPQVDVTYFQTEGSRALLSVTNPYAITFRDFFSGFGGEPVYGPGVSVDGILQFGFPYPPLSLLLVAPFHALFDDFRIAIALAYVVTAWIVSRIGEPTAARRASVLFLLLSPTALIVAVGFSEPLLAMAGVSVIWVHQRKPRWSAYVLGGFVALKQYAFIVAPAYLLLMPRPWGYRAVAKQMARAIAVFAIVTFPFFVWNPEAMMRSLIFLQMKQPFRADAITFTAQVLSRYVPLSALALTVLPIAAAVAATFVALRYAPGGVQGYAIASALILVSFFLFAKQSSAPNYFVVVMAFCFAAASMRQHSTDPSDTPKTASLGVGT